MYELLNLMATKEYNNFIEKFERAKFVLPEIFRFLSNYQESFEKLKKTTDDFLNFDVENCMYHILESYTYANKFHGNISTEYKSMEISYLLDKIRVSFNRLNSLENTYEL